MTTTQEKDTSREKIATLAGIYSIALMDEDFEKSEKALDALVTLIDEAKAEKTTKKDVLDWLFDHDRDMYYKLLNKDE